jgi:hypothetical protein
VSPQVLDAVAGVLPLDPAEHPLGSEECLAQMVPTVRSAYSRHVGEPMWANWVERMSASNSLFASMWGKQPGVDARTVQTKMSWDGQGPSTPAR